MGWNTSALFIEGRSVAELLRLLPDVFGYEPTGATVTAETAWSGSPGERLYLAEAGGWCQMWDPDQRFAPRLESLMDMAGPGQRFDARILAVSFSGVTNTYAFWLFDGTRRVRSARFESGTCADASGSPLDVEATLEIPTWGHDEDFVWGVIEDVTGVEQDLDQAFEVYRVEM